MQRIAHLADIHIQDRRRAEYAEVFEALYVDLRTRNIDLIVVAGDVFDNKMRASPHNLTDVAAFFAALAKIAPVILITGNHDTNCLTPGSLDLLTPLIADHQALQPPILTYWRDSGVYFAHGMVWTVVATDGRVPTAEEEQKLIDELDVPTAPRICLFHEEVNGTLLPNGTQLREFKLSKASFDRYDLTMGGHIHLRQKISPRAAYCGSLVQQNIGEHHHGHGYLLWDLTSSTECAPYRTAVPVATGINIKNNRGFVRVEVDANGVDVTTMPLQSTPLYWEVMYAETAPRSLVAEIVAHYEVKFSMKPRAVRVRPRMRNEDVGDVADAKTDEGTDREALVAAQAASRTLASHQEIIQDLLFDNPYLDDVLELHDERWVEPSDLTSGGKFRIIRMEFDNMYAFGPANVVDFTALEGCVSGIVAPNHTGKSSLIETLLFALYEEYPRAPSKKDIIHRGAGACKLTLEFELDGKRGKIIKGMFAGKHDKSGSQYRFEYDGEDRTRGGTTETVAAIAEVLGGATNALASSFQLQGGESGGFIGTNPATRKRLVANAMALGSFEALEKSVSREFTELGSEVKVLASQFRGETTTEIEDTIVENEGDLEDLCEFATKLRKQAADAQADASVANQELGICLGEDKSIQLALSAAKTAAAGRKITIPDDDVRYHIDALHKLLNPLTKIEKDVQPSSTFPREVPQQCDVTASTIARLDDDCKKAKLNMDVAVEAEMVAIADKIPERAATAAFTDATAAVKLAATRLSALQNAEPFDATRDFEPQPVAPTCVPTGTLPGQSVSVNGCRLGPRPSAAQLTAAIDTMKKLSGVAIDRELASRWDKSRYDSLSSELRRLSSTSNTAPLQPRCAKPSGVPHTRYGEVKGEKPIEAAVQVALNIVKSHTVDQCRAAQQCANKTLLNQLKESTAGKPNTTSVENASADVATLTDARDKCKYNLVSLGPASVAASKKFPPETKSMESVSAAKLQLETAQGWAAASSHVVTIGKLLRPVSGCSGCKHAGSILNDDACAAAKTRATSADVAYQRALAVEYHTAQQALSHARENLKTAQDTLAIAQDYAKLAIQQSAVDISNAVSVLETDNYWAAYTHSEWALYEVELSKHAANMFRADTVRSEIKLLDSAKIASQLATDTDSAITIIEIANYWEMKDSESVERYKRRLKMWTVSCDAAKIIYENAASSEANNAKQSVVVAGENLKLAEEQYMKMKQTCENASQVAAARIDAEKILNSAEFAMKKCREQRAQMVSDLHWWKQTLKSNARVAELNTECTETTARAAASSERVSAATERVSEFANTAAELHKQSRSMQEREHHMVREIARLTEDLNREEARSLAHDIASRRQGAMRAYRAVLRPSGGIADALLERGRAALGREINAALRELGAQFSATITKKYDVTVTAWTAKAPTLPASLGSGYQKFVLSLAARLAIWRLSASPRPDAFVVDEGFGSCDEDYLESIAVALESLAASPSGPKLVFLVSHVDALKVRVERALEIEVMPSCSRVSNSAQAYNNVMLPSGPGENNGAVMVENTLIPDPENVGKLYCEICRQSLRLAWGAKHLSSKKHDSAVKKANQ